ncbi:Dynamin like protein [Aduncisulcus paluster]|uniref:Dynamin like protein n=1 Tax=Aduncisulcus paluster TaxID=2918883 RepID=A0ABQ5JQR4_9EUKA|nr:Dynamin like protein [Aduncisulcus paluster]
MDEILTVLRNASGSKPSLFIPPHAFELFAKRAISRLESPSVRCVDLVCDELSRIARHCPPAEMRRYTALTSRTVHVAENLIKKLHAPTRVFVTDVIGCEMSYINTKHPDLSEAVKRATKEARRGVIGEAEGGGLIEPNPETEKDDEDDKTSGRRRRRRERMEKEGESEATESSISKTMPSKLSLSAQQGVSVLEQSAVSLVPPLLNAYFGLVKNKIQDTTIKAISKFLIDKSIETLRDELVSQVYGVRNTGILLEEDPMVAEQRKSEKKKCEMLQQARAVLDEVGEMGKRSSVSSSASSASLGREISLRKMGEPLTSYDIPPPELKERMKMQE